MPALEFPFASEVFNLAGQTAPAVPVPLDTPIHFAGHTIVIRLDRGNGPFPYESEVRASSGRIVGGGWHDTAEASLEAAKAIAEA